MTSEKTNPVETFWSGEVDGEEIRIVKVNESDDDCIVEQRNPETGSWFATDDEMASHAYEKAFLEARKLLKDIAE